MVPWYPYKMQHTTVRISVSKLGYLFSCKRGTYVNDSIYKFRDAEAVVDLVLAAARRENLIELELARAGRHSTRRLHLCRGSSLSCPILWRIYSISNKAQNIS